MIVSGGFVRTIPIYLLLSTVADDLSTLNIDLMASESVKFRCKGSEKLVLCLSVLLLNDTFLTQDQSDSVAAKNSSAVRCSEVTEENEVNLSYSAIPFITYSLNFASL